MAKLQVPAVDGSTNYQNINPDEVASKVASGSEIGRIQRTQGAAAIAEAAKIGQIQQGLGEFMASQGTSQVVQASKAMTEAMYNIVQSSAVKDYNNESDQATGQLSRMGNTGEGGYTKAKTFKNPRALEGQLDGIAKNVHQRYSQGLDDPESKAKFNSSLSGLNENRKASARQLQRNSEYEVASSSLKTALDTDIQSGLKDSPENLGYYASQGLDRIKNALETGVISTEQAASYGDNLRKGLYLGSLQVQNQTDPASVNQLLSSHSAADLNLNDLEYNKLAKQNAFAMQDINTLSKIQYKTQNELESSKRSMYKTALGVGIKAGDIHSAQIVEAYDSGKIDFKQYSELANKYMTAQVKVDKTLQSRNDLSAAISTGQILSGFTEKQIDDHYQNRLKLASAESDGKLDIDTKVNIASEYKGPVPSLSKEIEWGLKSGNMESIKSSVYAYNKLNDENPIALAGIKDKKLISYISSLSNAFKYTDKVDQAQIQKIHDNIYNVDGRTLTARQNEFSTKDEFSDDTIRKTIANMYDDANPWYRTSDYVDDNIVSMIKPLLRDAYNATGSVDDAVRSVASSTKGFMGHSEVNNVKRWGIDSGVVMALPPERVLQGKATALNIRAAINAEVKPMLPQGVEPDDVMVGSDDLTVAQFRGNKNPSYYLYYLDDEGKEILLPGRWAYDSKSEQAIGQPQSSASQQPVTETHQNAVVPTKAPVSPAQQTLVSELKKEPASAKVFRDEKVLEDVASSSYVHEMARKYPGDEGAKPVVESALTRMIGPDQDAVRVSKSLNLINRVLTGSGESKTYLKYGVPTDSPQTGDIVVTAQNTGLFQGYEELNGRLGARYVSVVNGNVVPSVVPLSEVKGFRSLPTPEEYSVQAEPIVPSTNAPRFNIYNGQPARIAQPNDRWNIYNNTVETNAKPVDTNTYLDPNGIMVPVNKSMQNKIEDLSNSKPVQSTSSAKIVANPQLTSSKEQDSLTIDNVVSKLMETSAPIDVGNGESVMPGELLSRLNFGKLTNSPSKDGIVIIDGQIGQYVGLDKSDTNKIKIKLGNKVISVLRNSISEFRELPKGKDAKAFIEKIKALLAKKGG